MGNYSLLMAIMIMLSINVGLALYDYGINSYNPAYSSLIDFAHSPASSVLVNGINGSANIDTSIVNLESSDSVDSTTGNIFTDVFKTISNWFHKLDSSLGIVSGILKQPMGFLKDIGVPAYIYNSFGVLWYFMLTFLIISFLRSGGVD